MTDRSTGLSSRRVLLAGMALSAAFGFAVHDLIPRTPQGEAAPRGAPHRAPHDTASASPATVSATSAAWPTTPRAKSGNALRPPQSVDSADASQAAEPPESAEIEPRTSVPVPPAPRGQIAEGREIFLREWTPRYVGPGKADGLGPLYNDTSCMGCHNGSGEGGSGPASRNVLLLVDSNGTTRTIHHFSTHAEHSEWKANIVNSGPSSAPQNARNLIASFSLPAPDAVKRLPKGMLTASQRNTPALFGVGLINSIPDKALIDAAWNSPLLPVSRDKSRRGRVSRVADGRIGRFGWKAQVATLHEFTLAACAMELGLNVPGHKQPAPDYAPDDSDRPVDLTESECQALTAFLSDLPSPRQRIPRDESDRQVMLRGEARFKTIGCADCHRPQLGDVEGIYSDLLLHDMGQEGANGASGYTRSVNKEASRTARDRPAEPAEWRTPPLWGVRDSGPYLHDGRAETLEKAIALHAGEANTSAEKFFALSEPQQFEVIAFLKSLSAPAPGDPPSPASTAGK